MNDYNHNHTLALFILLRNSSSYANIVRYLKNGYHVSGSRYESCSEINKKIGLRDILMPQKELQVAQHAITNQGKKVKPTLGI